MEIEVTDYRREYTENRRHDDTFEDYMAREHPLIERARAAMVGVTGGPWAFHEHDVDSKWFGNIVGSYGLNKHGIQEIRTITCQLKYGDPSEQEANARFIAFARTGVPELVEAVEVRDAALDALLAILDTVPLGAVDGAIYREIKRQHEGRKA